MTLVTATVEDVHGSPDNSVWIFHSLLRGSGADIVTPKPVRVTPVAGVLSITLDPGYSAVAYRGKEYTIEVPASGTANLWELIAASVAFPPGTPPTLVAAAVMGYLSAHPLTPSDISGSGTAGRAVLVSGTQAEGRTALGGTSVGGAVFTAANAAAARTAFGATTVGSGVVTAADTAAARSAIEALGLVQAAKNPDLLVTGAVTLDGNDLVTSAAVVWPDGTVGTLTITSRDANNGVLAYNITYGSPVTRTFTQPAITRNATGAATNVPAIVVT